MFSTRTGWRLAPNELTRHLEARRRAGLPVLDLTQSNATHSSFHYPAAILEALARPEALRYEPHPRGILEARSAVPGYYARKGVRVDPEQVILTASTSEAYSFCSPCWPTPGTKFSCPAPAIPCSIF